MSQQAGVDRQNAHPQGGQLASLQLAIDLVAGFPGQLCE
jgi:hypothetical protein